MLGSDIDNAITETQSCLESPGAATDPLQVADQVSCQEDGICKDPSLQILHPSPPLKLLGVVYLKPGRYTREIFTSHSSFHEVLMLETQSACPS